MPRPEFRYPTLLLAELRILRPLSEVDGEHCMDRNNITRRFSFIISTCKVNINGPLLLECRENVKDIFTITFT